VTVVDSDKAPDSAVSDSGQAHYSTREASTELPSVALVEAVAAAKDVDPLALDPLGNHVDMDALDSLLLQSSPGEHAVAVTVELQGVRAEIDDQGTVTVRQSGPDEPGGDQ
jgi:hypothetical protein